MSKSVFKFKKFTITQSDELHKVGTDAMVLGALIDGHSPKSILDVGTGCGVIALMLAQKFSEADIIAIDIDEKAISLAEMNCQNAPFANSFSLQHIDFMDYKPTHKFDLIVSNPPYYNSKMPSKLQQRNVARHENSMTIVQIIHHATQLLNEDGDLWLILPKERTDALFAIREQLRLPFYRIPIYGKPNKHVRDVLIFTTKMKKEGFLKSLVIRTENGEYTQQYRRLTQPYHYNNI